MRIRLIVSAVVVSAAAASVAFATDGAPAKGGAAPAAAAPAAAKASATAIGDVKWAPFNPADPKGLQVAFVVGDGKAAGLTQFLLKMPAGSKAPQHMHTGDYYGAVLVGNPTHGDDEKSAKAHAPGSTWFEPGKHAHFDACPGKEDCVVMITYPAGPPDFIPVGADGKPLPPPAPAKK